MSELLGEMVEPTEVVELLDSIPASNPAFFLRRWPSDLGQPQRWEHVPADLAERGRQALRQMRARGRPGPNAGGRGCAWCGVSTSASWTRSPWRWGRDRKAPQGSICHECLPWVKRSGAFSGWGLSREHLLAACCGMTKAAMDVHYNVKAFYESGPADVRGTATRWEYLGPVRGQLRQRLLVEHPRLIVPTSQEKRVAALQAFLAEAERPPQPASKLADV